MTIKMYLWNTKELAEELGQDCISEKTGMHYFLVGYVIILFDTYYGLWWGTVLDWLFYLQGITVCVIAIIGCLEAFKSNGSNEGQNFVKRAICLSVPVGIRVFVLSVLLGLCLYFTAIHIFTTTLFGDPLRAAKIVSYAIFVGFNIYYWWLMIQGFKQVQQSEKNPGTNHLN